MNFSKKLISFVLIIATMFSLSIPIFADDQTFDNTYTYEKENIEIEIRYSELTDAELQRIVSLFVGGEGAEAAPSATYDLMCTLFGHKITTTDVTVTQHNVHDTIPYCEKLNYKVETCERCDYTKPILISTEDSYCCS